MDRLIYTAMTGAKHVFMQQAGVANNLANVGTTGFRAQEHRFQAVPVLSEALDTRAFVVDASVSDKFQEGPVTVTDNPLDVAIKGRGWFSVIGPDGSEAYTRAGALDISSTGQLQTKSGQMVLGDAGPLTLPADNRIQVAPDGIISAVPIAGTPNNVNVIGRLKLVNPAEGDLVRGDDGLFRLKSGVAAPADPSVRVLPGALEGSNVNPTDAMVNLISLSRQFEMQIKMIQTAETNAKQADQILSMNG